MKENKAKKFLVITSFLSIAILLIGTTFSFFTYDTKSRQDALALTAGQIRINLGVSNLYTGRLLVPLKDELIMKAYEHKCVDAYGWGACQAYSLELFNSSNKVEIESFIDFKLNGIGNLTYMVLDEEENIYKDITHVDSNNPTGLTLGDSFILEDGSEEQTSKKLILLIWITDTGEIQDKEDAGGSFTATVTFRTASGNELTGFVQGIESSVEATSIID